MRRLMAIRTSLHSPSPLRRRLFGYSQRDVEDALAHLHRQLDGLAASVDRLYQERQVLLVRVHDHHEVTERLLREQAERLEHETDQRLAASEARAAELVADARAEAARLRAEAEEQAAALRHAAGKRVGDAASRLEDLLHVRERLLGELRGLLSSYARLLSQHDGGPLERPASDSHEQAQGSDRVPDAPLIAVVDADVGLYPTKVHLDVGPFDDFSQLSAFERAFARLPKVNDVYVRGFGDERAEIEVSLIEETPLAHDIASRLPYDVRIQREGRAKLVIDIVQQAAVSRGSAE